MIKNPLIFQRVFLFITWLRWHKPYPNDTKTTVNSVFYRRQTLNHMRLQAQNVAILMATYQGERYLREQLLSIQAQSFSGWDLYVRDDGSADATPHILQEFAGQDGRIHILPGGEHKGAKRNFMELLAAVNAPYYMFCDQDDVWLPGKVERTLAEMQRVEQARPGLPVAVFADLYVVDEHLNILSPSFWEYSRIRPERTSFQELGVRCVATGCAMMINARAKSVALPMPDAAKMHDVWITLAVAKHGGVLQPLREPLIYYRQHSGNVIGAARETRWDVGKRLLSLGRVLKENRRQYAMLQCLGYGSLVRYWYNKLIYILH